MKSKICTCCGIEKSIEQFGINNAKKDGRQAKCKICLSAYCNNRRRTDEFREKRRKTRNRVKENTRDRERYAKKKLDEIPQYIEMLEKAKERSSKYRKKLKSEPDKLQKLREYKEQWSKNKKENDPIYRTYRSFRSSFRTRFKSKNKQKTFEILNYSFNDLMNKIGVKKPKYHLDHKIPVSWFKEFIPNEVYHLENLHWITEKENLTKINFWAHPIPTSYFLKIQHNIKPEYLDRFQPMFDNMVDVKLLS